MKNLFKSILNKASILKIVGVLITALGLGTVYLSGEIQEDAKKGIATLDSTVLK